ncbi:O-antigen ligase-like membrane protein [Hypnocyclicus thermotrophus]|uniref:O-antigen ligase-like membrane protein n=1 Tax=Hypnocyclicus thermotrophus TaxID=1627895 RepID=A0AA46I5A2_9FUSO|nr:O-antigen ligase family protein [Hypnocyclicus thermotrophus]TDT69718.1 O-antigen ligase-like membrane protein [Hypnocyclicus thermotrophus]
MNKENRVQIILISILISFLSLVVFLKKIPLKPGTIEYLAWPVSNINYDFFSFYKSRILILFVAFALPITAINKWGKIDWKNHYLFLFIYILFAILSAVFSPFPQLAYNGVADRYESLSVLIAYIMLFFIINNSISNEKDLKSILIGVTIVSIGVALIGIFQYYGYDIFSSNFGRKLILPKDLEYLAKNLRFKFQKYQIYSTLYNPNYVGSFMTLTIFLGIGMYLYHTNIKKIFWYFYTLLMFANLVGCRSRGGFTGFIFSLLIFSIFYFKFILKNFKQLLFLFLSIILVFYLMNVSDKADKVLIKKYSTYFDNFDTGLRDLYIEGNTAIIRDKNTTLKIENIDNTKVVFLDINNNQIKTKIKTNTIYLLDDNYKNFRFELKKNALNFKYGDTHFEYLLILMDNTFKTVDNHNKIMPILTVPHVKLLEGYEKMGSFRIYNWSRTIPIIKDTLILGYGPDTFSIVFPQKDYFGKLISYGTKSILIDKPHNMYLQIAVNTGVISLIALIGLFLHFFIKFIKNRVSIQSNSFPIFISHFIGLGIIAYLITATFNDSVVSVAPLFWTFFGSWYGILELKK